MEIFQTSPLQIHYHQNVLLPERVDSTGPLADKERLSAALFVSEAHVPLFGSDETLGNYPAAHRLRASAVVHVLVSAAFGAIYL